jgi:hypothetical protein
MLSKCARESTESGEKRVTMPPRTFLGLSISSFFSLFIVVQLRRVFENSNIDVVQLLFRTYPIAKVIDED